MRRRIIAPKLPPACWSPYPQVVRIVLNRATHDNFLETDQQALRGA